MGPQQAVDAGLIPLALDTELLEDIRSGRNLHLLFRHDGPQPLAYHRAGELLRRRLGDIGSTGVRVRKIAEILPIGLRR